MDVNEVLLPGVGLRYEFVNHEGDRIRVVAQRSDDFELVVYPGDDPDEAQSALRLIGQEADALAEILGAPRIAERFADLTREMPGLNASQVEVRPGNPFAGRALGDPRARARTGASIVAVVRGEDVIASPVAGPCRPETSWWRSARTTASAASGTSSRADRSARPSPCCWSRGPS
jgi:TrkA domain protein